MIGSDNEVAQAFRTLGLKLSHPMALSVFKFAKALNVTLGSNERAMSDASLIVF